MASGITPFGSLRSCSSPVSFAGLCVTFSTSTKWLLNAYLTKQMGAKISGDIKWNFTKFLVDCNGKVAQRFEPAVTSDSKEVTGAIEKQLK